MLALILPHPNHMGSRRQARERAVQFLFQIDMNPEEDLDSALEHFWLHQRPEVTWGALQARLQSRPHSGRHP